MNRIHGDPTLELADFGLDGQQNVLNDTDQLDRPQVLLTPCVTGRLSRWKDELEHMETHCTECSCIGDMCQRTRRYVVRNRTGPDVGSWGPLPVTGDWWDSLCDVFVLGPPPVGP